MNWRLAIVLFAMGSVVVTGVLLTVGLALGYEDSKSVWIMCSVGMLLAVPMTFVATRHLENFTKNLQHH